MICRQHFSRHPEKRHHQQELCRRQRWTRRDPAQRDRQYDGSYRRFHNLKVLTRSERRDDASHDTQGNDGEKQNRRERNRPESDPAEETNH